MIKRPKEISNIFKKISAGGYDVYFAGQCIVAAAVGEEAQEWDIYTDCSREKLCEIFPEGEKIGKRTLRLDYSEEIVSDDLDVADGYDGITADIVTLDGAMEEQLKIYDYTVEAVAESLHGKPIDPFGGREDAKKLILRPVGDIVKSFERTPVKVLTAIKYTSLYNFDLSKELSAIIAKNNNILGRADKEDILTEFTLLMSGDYAGKAMKMLVGLNLLQYIVGTKAAKTTKAEAKEYEVLAENIGRTKPIPLRRLGLFYMRFAKNYKDAIEYLPHQEQDLDYLLSAKNSIRSIHFINNDTELKRYIHRHGWDKYYYIDKLQKAEAIVFDANRHKIEARDFLLREVKNKRDPIFPEDLVIDANDIMEAGITEDAERAEWLLSLLPDVVHRRPQDNDRKILLKCAKNFNRSRFRRAVRDVNWLR